MNAVRTVVALLLLTVLAPVVLFAGFNLDGQDWPDASLTPRSFASRPLPVEPVVIPVPNSPAERASRGLPRRPVPVRPGSVLVARPAARVVRAPTRAAGTGTVWRSLGVQDITAYCTTGNTNAAGHWPRIGEVAVLDRSIPFGTHVRIAGLGEYVVMDWIGHGSQWDLYWGAGDCETRASNFGRQHREVEIAR